jgi:hypothetical protein
MCPEIRASPVDWAQPNSLLPEDGDSIYIYIYTISEALFFNKEQGDV